MQPGHFFILIENNNAAESSFESNEDMKVFVIKKTLINHPVDLYHTNLPDIIIKYDYLETGEVTLAGTDQGNRVNVIFSDLFTEQREEVEEALRRVAKLEVLLGLYQMNDANICKEIDKHGFELKNQTINEYSNIPESQLNGVLMQIKNLGKVNTGSIVRFFSHPSPTLQEKQVSQAFEALFSGSSGLEQLKSKKIAQAFINSISSSQSHTETAKDRFVKKGK